MPDVLFEEVECGIVVLLTNRPERRNTLGLGLIDVPRLVGVSRSAELMLTGRIFDVQEAKEMGLVLEVVDDAAVVDRALATGRQIAKNAPLAAIAFAEKRAPRWKDLT